MAEIQAEPLFRRIESQPKTEIGNMSVLLISFICILFVFLFFLRKGGDRKRTARDYDEGTDFYAK